MPKKASPDDAIDPVRSRLAAEAAAPIKRSAPQKRQVATEKPQKKTSRASKPRILTVNRKIMVTEQEAEQIELMTNILSSSFGSKVTYSQVSRALWSIVAGAEDAIRSGARRAPKLRVPSKGDHVAMAEYEEALADFLATALKRS